MSANQTPMESSLSMAPSDHSDPITGDVELTLSAHDQRVVVSPLGASLRRYFIVHRDKTERDIVWGYHGAANKKGGQGDVLVPFPGRVAGGHYRFEGKTHELE